MPPMAQSIMTVTYSEHDKHYHIMRIVITFFLTLLIAISGKAKDLTIHVKEAGNLVNQIDISKVEEIDSLTISGDLNGTDILVIRKMQYLTYLDMRDANIVSGGQSYGSFEIYDYDTQKWKQYDLYTADNSIGRDFFSNYNPITILFPNSVNKIGGHCFYVNKKSVVITLGKNIVEIEDKAFDGILLEDINFPDSLTTIGTESFSNTKLTAIDLPESIQSIGIGSFSSCKNLVSVSFSSSIKCISSYSFSGCNNLSLVEIKDGVEDIGESAFSGCESLEHIEFPKSLIKIGKDAFSYSGLTSIEIPCNILELGYNVLSHCKKLKQVEICDGYTPLEIVDIPTNAQSLNVFQESPIQEIYLGRNFKGLVGSVWSNDFSSFFSRSLEKATIGESVTEIGVQMFDATSIKTITLPNVQVISSLAFGNCTELKELILGEHPCSIGSSAFCGYTPNCNLQKIVCNSKTPPSFVTGDWNPTFCNKTYRNAVVYVPSGCREIYLSSDWSHFSNILEIDNLSSCEETMNDKEMIESITSISGYHIINTSVKELTNGIYIINGKKTLINR